MEILIGVLVGLGVLLLLLLLLCSWKIGEAETGVSVLLGEIRKVHKSGLVLELPRPIIRMVRFTKTQFELEYDVTQVITRMGYYYPEIGQIGKLNERIKEIIEEIIKEELRTKELGMEKNLVILKEKETQLKETREELERVKGNLQQAKQQVKEEKEEMVEFNDSVEIPKIAFVIYLRYSTDDDLMKTLEVLGGPKNQEQLRVHYKGVSVGYFRDIVGTIPWRAVVENREYIVREMQKRFTEPESPFMVAGFKAKNIYVAMTMVNLPEELTKLLNLPQQEKLRAKAAKHVAQKLNEEIGFGIGKAAETLEKTYGFPRERAQEAVIERHGDILAAREGELKRIQWITKGGGSTVSPITPEMIAQSLVIAQEILKKAPPTPSGEAAKEPPTPAEAVKPAEVVKPTEAEPENEVERLLAQKVLTEKDLTRLAEVLAKLPKEERDRKLQELEKKTAIGEIKTPYRN